MTPPFSRIHTCDQNVDSDAAFEVLLDIGGDEVDALVQVGTNLSMLRLAHEADRWLDKPALAINAPIEWMALRDNGIDDKIASCGRLLREF